MNLLRGLESMLLALFCIFTVPKANTQTPAQIQLAFRNIRSDDIPKNAALTAQWLFANRNAMKADLLDEVYRTDRQGRDAIMFALFNVDKFDPDERFCQMVIKRINEEERFVKNRDLSLDVHWHAWIFVNQHYEKFKPLILENLRSTDNMLCIWATTWLLAERGDLDNEVAKFPDRIWNIVAQNLREDDIPYNAGQALRFYLIIGRPALVHLANAAKVPDDQVKDYATAAMDAINGKRTPYGYFGSQVIIDKDLFGEGNEHPAWYEEEFAKWDPHSQKRQRYK